MCGICGIVNFKGKPINREVLGRMGEVLRHRGPDDEGMYVSNSKLKTQNSKLNIGLGHRRLSVIDLDTGHQPMSNEDGTVWIVFNGEIYNFQDLRLDLEKKGYRFFTRSDTEVIIHLYEEYGTDCLKFLRGMFALAIWDERKGRLFLARDRVGQKPLCYIEHKGQFIFASELKSILQVPRIPREINLEAMHHYLTYQYVPAPLTMFQGIKKLPPAHFLIWEKGQVRIERYWKLSFQPGMIKSEDDCREGVRTLFEEAVKLRLVSDVPLGAFLSGGVDSTAVVGMMSRLSNRPVKTFSIGFEEKAYNELEFARLAAKYFKTEHHEFIIKPEALKILPKLIWHYNEPFADSSAIPTYYVAEKTREYVTVALSGDGGDESFAGYPRYRAVKLAEYYQRLPVWLREKLIRKWAEKLPPSFEAKTFRRRLKRFLGAISLPPERRYARWVSFFDERMKEELYSSRMKKATKGIDSFAYLENVYEEADGSDFLAKTLYVDMKTYLPDDLLVKVDIATMAHSLEARSPFLDHKLMEFAASIPSHLKLKGLTGKYILKKSLRDLLPPPIRRRSKMGFGVPISHWFRNELKDYLSQVLLSEGSLKRGYFQEGYIRRLLNEHCQGSHDHGNCLWALLNLELWQQMFVDRIAGDESLPTRAVTGGACVLKDLRSQS
ncbi:asparagine synthase (glutamine-hydrolyzing) [candidate division NPL-UPA2 bacterium]|nr:asparagine synthase (glutamine-hydrolyzing) [candidate division NPL-UPA2 bacterium]